MTDCLQGLYFDVKEYFKSRNKTYKDSKQAKSLSIIVI